MVFSDQSLIKKGQKKGLGLKYDGIIWFVKYIEEKMCN